MLSAYPLSWPEGWKRTPPSQQKYSRFKKAESRLGQSYVSHRSVTVSDGVTRILESLGKMGVDRNDIIISTNVKVRLDGLPRSGEKEPEDCGAAVYWKKNEKSPMRCMGIDIYDTVSGNLAAIAATLEAMRAIERHGGAEILDRTFTGFSALPSTASQSWRETLLLDPNANYTREQIKQQFSRLAHDVHPDTSSTPDPERFQKKVLGGRPRGRKQEPLRMCQEEGTRAMWGTDGIVKRLCPYHAQLARLEEVVTANKWEPHPKFAWRIPMPGYRALVELDRQVRSL